MFVPTGRFYGSNVYFRIPYENQVTFIFCYYNLLGGKNQLFVFVYKDREPWSEQTSTFVLGSRSEVKLTFLKQKLFCTISHIMSQRSEKQMINQNKRPNADKVDDILKDRYVRYSVHCFDSYNHDVISNGRRQR